MEILVWKKALLLRRGAFDCSSYKLAAEMMRIFLVSSGVFHVSSELKTKC